MRRRDFVKTPLIVAGAAMVGKAGLVSGLLGAGMAHATQRAGVPDIALNNGMKIPQLGLGTWTLRENATACVRAAIESGYRLFDTAQMYGNEKQVWEGIKQSGIARKDVFITSKISTNSMRNPPQRDSIDKSIELLGGEYIDLFMIHWPVKDRIQETWVTMEEYVRKGLIKSIGFSNFNPHHIETLLKYAKVKPVLNQIEIHPYHTQEPNVAATRGYGIAVESWSPLAQGKVMSDGAILGIGKKHNKSAAQVTLRWHIQRGLVVIPRSKNPKHIAENIGIFDFELSRDDMAAISGLNRSERVIPGADPDNFSW
ncbi:MAG: aldo/keto reductase [Azoarcus sp.]|jgi:2,5-diketo-D-gluconate reductase A|nr:aldo/keto reductase [Azoarcus sp.]